MDSRSAVLTYGDYVALPDDGRRYELHDGVLSMTPAPGTRHQRVSRNLGVLLHRHVEARRLGEVFFAPIDVILSETTVVQPDLVYVAGARHQAVSERGIEGPPTLVVEILSPSTATIDRVTKARLYAQHGVPFLWLVDPEVLVVEAFTLRPGGYECEIRATGESATGLPPFPDLVLVPASLWPATTAQ